MLSADQVATPGVTGIGRAAILKPDRRDERGKAVGAHQGPGFQGLDPEQPPADVPVAVQ